MTEFSNEKLKQEAKRLFESLKHLQYSMIQCMAFAPLTSKINKLKKEKKAVVLAHNYQRAEILFGVADYYGDSLSLARNALKTDAKIIIFAGVKFMAETAKILNNQKKILLPDLGAGCSLSEGITAKDVRLLKKKNPGKPIVTYINTSAEVKAESDVIVTSSNALKIVDALDEKEIIFIPDTFMAENLQKRTKKKLIKWNAKCVVHESFRAEQIKDMKKEYPKMKVFAHYECNPEVVALADIVGSTSQMEAFVQNNPETKEFMFITECGMSDLLRVKYPEKEFIVPCSMCPFMKKITLENILHVLKTEENEIIVDEDVRTRALKALERI